MLEREFTKKALEKFSKYVVSQSRANLTRKNMKNSSKLYNSIKGYVEASRNSFSLAFEMEDYGKFQDKGVRGAASSQRAPNSPYRFGSDTGKKGGLTNSIRAWVQQKRIQFRDLESGKFMSYEATSKLIARAIYMKGLYPTNFFSGPFEKGYQKLPEELIKAYNLDLESFLKYTIQNNDSKST